jgi:hypothetical protein
LKFADIDSANGANLAEHFNGLDTSTPKDAFQSVNTVEGKLQNLIKTEPDTQAQLNYLEKQPGYNADIRQKLNGVRDQLKDGKVVDPQAINDIGDALRPIAPVGNEPSGMVARQSDKLVQALQDYNSLNKVKAAGNYDPQAQTFGNKVTGLGALANSPALTPRWNPYHMGLEGMALHYLTGMAGIPSVAVAAGLPLSQMAIRAGVRGLDSATGMRSNPLDQFTSRFGQGSNDSALPRGDVTSAALASNSVPLGPVDTSVTDATSSVDSLLHPQQQPASRRQTATQQPQAPAPAQPKASPETPVVNFRDVLEQRNLLAKAQALSDKQQAKANTLVDNGVGSIARANALQAAQEPVAAPVTQEAASGRNTPIEGDTISTSKDGHTVVADANSVAKQAAWAAAVRKRIGVRSDVMNEAEALVDHDPQALPQLAQIRSDLSAQSLPSQEAARQMIDKHLAKMKPHHRAAVRHLLHSPRMMSTFKP